ncbi:MAG TPA: DUF4177 domain-containing protein [Candidatus Woesebacteria bacterium]|nr:DUF4177 domain-containing protein [Candidatus Woesebacteria bacterium]
MYEYKTVNIKTTGFMNSNVSTQNIDQIFNEMAQDGWEYVDNREIITAEWTQAILFIFKRKK